MTIRNPLCAAFAAALLVAVPGCKRDGGGSSDGCANRPAPLASAGADQVVAPGGAVSLEGQGSSVPGAALSYQWKLAARPPGSAAALSDPTVRTALFVADLPGVYVGLLTVSDGCATSAPDVAVVTASAGGGGACAGANPAANAGGDLGVGLHSLVTLDGTGSVGNRGLALTYFWTFTSRPDGSAAALSYAASAHPSFTPDLAGTYVASLVVSDGCGSSAPDAVTVTAANRRPVAVAGTSRSIPVGVRFALGGAGSWDPDGDPLSFSWTLPTIPPGSAAALDGATTATPSFLPDLAGTYVASLVVSDGQLASSASSVTLVAANLPPVANAGPDRAGNVGTAVSLDGRASADPNLTPLSYAWTLVTRPPGSAAALAGGDTATPSFVPDVVGTYVASLVVSDGSLSSVPDSVAVGVDGAVELLGRHVLDAEFSGTLDRIVMVSGSPSELAIRDPQGGSERTVALPLPPQCVSVTPDGLYAAVGHAGVISWVDLDAATLVTTFRVSADVFDVVASGNGYVYAFPRVDQWVEIHTVNVATGAETLSSSWAIRAGTRAKLQPGALAIYGADNGLSPADIEKYSIAGGTAQFLRDSPYHGDYAMCGDLWLSADGARIFTKCGNVFRTSPLPADDMRWAGSLSPGTSVSLAWVSDSAAANEIAVLPAVWWNGGDDTTLQFYERVYLARTSTVKLPRLAVGAAAYATHGRFVFHRADGSARYVLVQVDAASGLLGDYALVVY